MQHTSYPIVVVVIVRRRLIRTAMRRQLKKQYKLVLKRYVFNCRSEYARLSTALRSCCTYVIAVYSKRHVKRPAAAVLV